MTITHADIALLASERLTDFEDGGGRITGVAVPDNVIGNLWPQISRNDRARGRVSLRKAALGVTTTGTEMLVGAGVMVTDPPADPKVQVLAFSTGAAVHYDERTAARNYIESYVVAGPEYQGFLYGLHVAGARAITLLQRVEAALPEIGTVFVLQTVVPAASQYVRVTDLRHEVRTFTDSQGDYQRRVVTCEIGSRLVQQWQGGDPTRFSTHNSPTKVLTTLYAAAARYYGVASLTADADAGALKVQVDDVFRALVPSATRETAITNATPGGAAALVPAGSAVLLVDHPHESNAGGNFVITRRSPRAFTPGTVSVKIDVSPYGAVTATDDGLGALRTATGFPGSITGGSVDYADGVVTILFSAANSTGRQIKITAVPAAEIPQTAHSHAIEIGALNRGAVYAPNLSPLPAPGTLIVDYLSLGRWYRLRDNGLGELVADLANTGSGTVNYATGDVVVTLGALPDLDSAVLFLWGSGDHYTVRAGELAIKPATLHHVTATPGLKPGTVSVKWYQGGALRTASDNGSGAFGGHGTGTVDYRTGTIDVVPTAAPDVGTTVTVDYQTGSPSTGSLTPGQAGRVLSGSLPGAPLRAGSVRISLPFAASYTFTNPGRPDKTVTVAETAIIVDNGSGALFGELCGPGSAIDYASGVFSINVATTVTRTVYGHTKWLSVALDVGMGSIGGLTWQGEAAGGAYTTLQDTPSFGGLVFDLTPTTTEAVVPGSVLFTWAGKVYVDRSGSLYTDVSPSTGAGTLAGSLDYTSGVATLSAWTAGAGNTIAVQGLLTRRGAWTLEAAQFRCPGAPIGQGSLYVRANRPNGDLVTVVADSNGVLASPYIQGHIDVETGIVRLSFEHNPGGGAVIEPVVPDTLRFNCVVVSQLPLDSELIGVDPVRLPIDGRVPIFRAGELVVVHHTLSAALPNGLTAGQVVTLPEGDLGGVELRDADGLQIPPALYAPDLLAGTVTMATPLSLAGFVEPLVARYTLEDVVAVADVQINGELTLVAPLTREYPAGARVSSLLEFGDLQARVANVFDQQTWTGEWSNSRIGSDGAASYNTVLYPIEVANRHAIKERWRVAFTSSTAYQVFGETVGQIATGSTAADCAPINPMTGSPYFRIRAAGWGGGWAAGNQLRFNTEAAMGPFWCSRTILPGASEAPTDLVRLLVRGDG